MNVVLLTTDTRHHTYFAWKWIEKSMPLRAIVVETASPRASFATHHPFEARRDEYEQEVLLAGFRGTLSDLSEVRSFVSVNGPDCMDAISSYKPDVVLVFGTGLLRPPLIGLGRLGCLNLHGGNPEAYRGLDSHLWTIYHRDFENLMTTLHRVEARFDTGDVISQKQLPIHRGMELCELRSANTKACLELSLQALDSLSRDGKVGSRPQRSVGRYYSFMPAVLKDDVLQKFRRYVEHVG